MIKNKNSTSITKKEKNNLGKFIQDGKILDVQSIIILCAVALLVSYIIIKEIFFPGISQIYNYFAIATSLVIIGFVGIIAIYRKEMPGPVAGVTLKGSCAIIAGLIVTIFFWGLVVAGAVFLFLQ